MNNEVEKALPEICKELGITLDARLVGPTTRPDGWKCDEWACILRHAGRAMTVPYFTGLGHRPKEGAGRLERLKAQPQIADVVSSLASDTTSGEETFADFCGNLGYDEDSRKVMDTYLACQKIGKDFRKLMGDKFDLVANTSY